MARQHPIIPIAHDIWQRKYRFQPADAGQSGDETVDDTFRRVARAAASAEPPHNATIWEGRFQDAMTDYGFLPAGRILAGAGTARNVTLFNCFVLGKIDDDLGGIFEGVKEAALTMQAGGGIGHDFSTLRPKGALVRSIGADASGPVSFMDIWDSMCRTIMSAGQRRGAMMATLRCDHPDIEEFIAAKSDSDRLRNFNLSVLVTDAFMRAVRDRQPWPLSFDGTVYRTVDAAELWHRLMRATYEYAEPGVIFIDRVNSENNLAFCETISATNPCGEQPLPAYGACLLGSINLAALVEHPFTPDAAIDPARLTNRVAAAVRFLDNVIDISRYPLAAQAEEARAKRRIGLGVTGLADALIFCGLTYGSPAAREQATAWMALIQNEAYRASAGLAAEKGAFPLYDQAAFLARPNVKRLAPDVQDLIRQHGIRNGCLTSIAPTGTISLLAGNVSSGIEPVFDFIYRRRVLDAAGLAAEQTVEDYAHRMFRDIYGHEAPLPDAFVTATMLSPVEHLAMQSALQPFVDSAISKTINCPESLPFAAFESVYLQAFEAGLKGCTTYRPNAVTGSVLIAGTDTSRPAGETPGQRPNAVGMPAVNRAAAMTPPRPQSEMRSQSEIVYMTAPLDRDNALDGITYKIKWPGSAHALYVTINDIERDGRRRPFEIFINTKNLEHYAWTVALTRMVSAVFRRGGDVSFVAEELKAVFDPEGGRWMNGAYVPSLLAAIGGVIEQHMIRTGFLLATADAPAESLPKAAVEGAINERSANDSPQAGSTSPEAGLRVCQRCGARRLRRSEGCWTCDECHYSRCG